jgi:hypothetical protein
VQLCSEFTTHSTYRLVLNLVPGIVGGTGFSGTKFTTHSTCSLVLNLVPEIVSGTYGLPSGYIPLQHLIQDTDIPELRNRICIVCDASFVDDRLTRESQQGHLINSGPIIWKNNRQHTITLSITEDELDSFVRCVRSVLHTGNEDIG